MSRKIKPKAERLVTTYPGVAGRRYAIILALCQGADCLTYGQKSAQTIVRVANEIIERTE